MTIQPTNRSFINPQVTDLSFQKKAILHNYYGLGRTAKLHQLLSPAEKSLTLRLQGLWANVYAQNFTSIPESKTSIYSELANIHPIILSTYQSEIEQLKTADEISRMSKKFFNAAQTVGKDAALKINKDLNSVGSNSTPASSPLSIRPFFRMIASLTPEELFNDQIKTIDQRLSSLSLPSNLREKYQNLTRTTDLDSLQTLASSYADSLVTDLKASNPTKRELITSSLRSTWTSVLESSPTNKEELLRYIADSLSELQLPGITDLYMKDLFLAESILKIQNRAGRYLHDLDSIKFNIPILPTSSGVTTHPKTIDWHRSERILGFMKHLGSKEELDQNLLYSFFLPSDSENNRNRFPCLVPSGVSLDHSESPTYTDSNGDTFPLSDKERYYIKDLTRFIATTTRKNPSSSIESELAFQEYISQSPIAIFDRIIGEDLENLFITQYTELPLRLKKDLFNQFGMISFLDISLGNQDRLIRLDVENPSLETAPLDSNLGNIMISHNKTSLHAIDNGIGDGKKPNLETLTANNAKYLDFLSNLFKNEQKYEDLSTNLINSLLISTINIKESIEDGHIKALQNILALETDLQNTLVLNEKIKKRRKHVDRLMKKYKSTKKASTGRAKRCNLTTQISSHQKAIAELEKSRDAIGIFSSLKTGMQVMEHRLRTQLIPLWNSPETNDFKIKLGDGLVNTITSRLNLLNPEKKKPAQERSLLI